MTPIEMKQITLKINSNEEIWSLIDKRLHHIFIHKFMPNKAFSWWKTDLKTQNGIVFNNLSVRQMQMDIQTDLDTLKEIIELNIQNLRIYQFDKPIPDTLMLERLPKQTQTKILKQNGLKHFFFINYEFLTIGSYDMAFLNKIECNPIFRNRIHS